MTVYIKPAMQQSRDRNDTKSHKKQEPERIECKKFRFRMVAVKADPGSECHLQHTIKDYQDIIDNPAPVEK
jgi:hypothetical protein